MNNKYYPMNSAEVLDQVLEVFKKSFFKQVALSIIFSIIFFVILYALLIFGVLTVVVLLGNIFFTTGVGVDGVVIISAFLLIIFLAIALYDALLTTGNALITKHTFLGEYCDVGGVLKASFKKIWIATSASIASLIVFLPGIFVLGVIIYLYVSMLMDFYDRGHTPTMALIIITILLGILMLAIFLVGATITMMSNKVAIFEGRWFFGAVSRSFRLVKPDFLKIMGLLAIWSIITMAATYSFESLFSLAIVLLGYFSPQEAAAAFLMGTFGIGSFFSLIMGVILAPLSGIFSTMIYMNQRIKLEGLDIELNLNNERIKQLRDK